MSRHWTESKLFKFLRLYKRYECLWNPYSQEYKSCDAKSEAFAQILYEMNVFGLTVSECLNQIKYIRQTYKQEQQRLENLASLGGRGYSNFLWYPIMNSMLTKVIQDEEKVNQETRNSDLVAGAKIIKSLPSNSGDQQTRGELRRRTFPWNYNETTNVLPYVGNPSYANDVDRYLISHIFNDSNVICTPSEHICSCPTCGYSCDNYCECSSINDIEYRQIDNFVDSYQPRTSYHYGNGMLEINSAVRIPVSQPSTNCGRNFIAISSYGQREIGDIEEEETLAIECCDDKIDEAIERCNLENTVEPIDHKKPNSSNLEISLGSFDGTRNSIGGTIENAQSDGDDKKPLANGQKNLNDHAESHKTEDDKKLFKVDDRNLNEANVEVEPAFCMVTEDQKENICSQFISDKELRSCDNRSIQLRKYDRENVAVNSRKTQTGGVSKLICSRGVSNDTDEKLPAAETTEAPVRESQSSIVKNNLTRVLIDFIDKTLNKPDQSESFDAEEKFILKKVAEELKALRNKKKRDSMAEDHAQLQQNCTEKSRTRTICWREPIEERFNIVPCRSMRFSAHQVDCKENVSTGKSVQSSIGTAPCSRLMAGADFDTENNTRQSDLSNCAETISEKQQINTGDLVMSTIQKTEKVAEAQDAKTKTSQNNPKVCDPSNSHMENVTELENGVSMNIAVKIANSTESERIDKVVDRITEILCKTLDRKGYTIERKEFFAEKNLITNDNGEIHRTTIGNETVWKTELRNIISSLMKHKKTGDSITFKVKTMILPVTNKSNLVAEAGTNLNLSFVAGETRKVLERTKSTACNEGFENNDSKILVSKSNNNHQFKNEFSSNHMRRCKRSNRYNFLKSAFRYATNSQKNIFNDVNQVIEHCDGHPFAMWMLWKYLIKVGKKFQGISKNHGKFLPNKPAKENQFKNYCKESQRNSCAHIDVYLRTEISEEDPLLMRENEDCISCPCNSGSQNIVENLMKSTTTVKEEYDMSDWETCSESDEGAEIVEHCGTQKMEKSFTESKTYKRFQPAENVDLSGKYHAHSIYSEGSIFPRRSYSAFYAPRESRKNAFVYLKHTQNHVQSSERSSKSWLNREFKELPGVSEYKISDSSNYEESESPIDAEVKTIANDEIKSCCTGDKSSHRCTPICDVTSRLRLCVITKSSQEGRAADRVNLSNNICCCDNMDRLLNSDAKTDTKPHEQRSWKDVEIGDANVQSMSTSSQTESCGIEAQGNRTSLHCGEGSESYFLECYNRAHSGNSVIDSNNKRISKDVKPLDISNPEANAQSVLLTPLDVSALTDGPVILEIKMLQPLFSIELKKQYDIKKAELTQRRCECEFTQQAEVKLDASVGRRLISEQQVSTSMNSVIGGRVQRTEEVDQDLILRNNEKQSSSSRIKIDQIYKLESNSTEKIEACSESSTPLNYEALDISEKNILTNAEDRLENGRDDVESLQYCEYACGADVNEVVLNTVVTSEEKESVPLREDEIKRMITETLINTVERSLDHVTDSIIKEKLDRLVKCIRNPDQNFSLFFKENSEALSEKSEIEPIPQSLSSTSKGVCQESCVAQIALSRNSFRDDEEIVDEVVVSQDGDDFMKNQEVKSSMSHDSITKKANSQISVDETQTTISIEEKIFCQETPPFDNNDNDEAPTYHCCDRESSQVDIDAFAITIASKLRALPTEAALRSQQRIQTLISNSRLESEKINKNR